jgi:23S rRNA pseudouridine1911/1915/1917 synthase
MQVRVPQQQHGKRLDHFLIKELPHLSRSRIQDLIRSRHILINATAVRSSHRIRAGDFISIEEPAAQPIKTEPEYIPLDILFEDSDLIVLNKPPGLVVHPAAGNWRGTLVNALLHHCPSLSGIGGEQRPGIIHRLDKETSGCMVVAKNDAAHIALSQQFASREVTKIYLTVVTGRLRQKNGTIEAPIGRHPVQRKKMAVVKHGRAATTVYRVRQEMPDRTLVECTLHTGRTHQVRVHLKQIAHPVLGDHLYGKKLAGTARRHLLHAWKLGFVHPRTHQLMQFVSPIPADFLEAGVDPNLK